MTEIDEATRTDLEKAIRKVRNRIARARDRGQSLGEENTKITLIDPILAALGWDIYEFDEVRREYKRKPNDNPVDYALFVVRSPRLFIEAKDLSKDLSEGKWISQTLGYATVVGVKWCVLTNGDEYRLYNSHAPVDVDRKLFRKFKLSESSHQDIALETLALLTKDSLVDALETLWNSHFIDRQVQATVERMFSEQDKSLVSLVKRKTPGLKPLQVRESLKRAEVRVHYPVPLGREVSEIPAPRRRKAARQVPPQPRTGLDTIVVPAREDGFKEVFLGENRWYAIRIRQTMIPKIRYIAAYQVAPVAAITHVAKVESIKPWPGTSKYVLNFAGPAKKIAPIERGIASAPQGPRYANSSKLENAKTLAEVF